MWQIITVIIEIVHCINALHSDELVELLWKQTLTVWDDTFQSMTTQPCCRYASAFHSVNPGFRSWRRQVSRSALTLVVLLVVTAKDLIVRNVNTHITQPHQSAIATAASCNEGPHAVTADINEVHFWTSLLLRNSVATQFETLSMCVVWRCWGDCVRTCVEWRSLIVMTRQAAAAAAAVLRWHITAPRTFLLLSRKCDCFHSLTEYL